MSPILSRVAFRRSVAGQERRLAFVARRLVHDIAALFGPEALARAFRAGSPDPRDLGRIRQAIAGRKAALQQALLGVRVPLREQSVAEIALRVAELEIGRLIREIELQQLNTIRWQLSVLFDRGPSDELVRRLGTTAGLTQRQARQVLLASDAAIAAGATEDVAARVARRLADQLMERRGRLIARTEAVRFTNEVVIERGRELGPGALKQWVSARDEDVDPVCRALDDDVRIPMAVAFPGGFMTPPAHPGCRCVLEVEAA